MTRTVTALFDSAKDVERAQARLIKLGVHEGDTRIISQHTTRFGDDTDGKSMFEWVKDFLVSDRRRESYEEGVRRGAYLLTARVDERQADEALAIMSEHHAIDLDRRTEEWRSQGWADSQDVTIVRSAEADRRGERRL